MLKFLSGELKGDTNKPDSPIRNDGAVDPNANGEACALNGELYGLNSEVCWGHVKLRCDKQGWLRMGECGHVDLNS